MESMIITKPTDEQTVISETVVGFYTELADPELPAAEAFLLGMVLGTIIALFGLGVITFISLIV